MKSGNKNAQKNASPLDNHVQIRCTTSDKRHWWSMARAMGMTLTDWIKYKLSQI
jgi:hypothetical protein